MNELVDEYIALALMEVTTKQKKQKMPKSFLSLGKMKEIAVTTAEIPIEKTGKYQDITSIERFENEFTLVGGVNVPKLIVCTGSNGKSYQQLVKGKDDLRQDAVMQQVFDMVNRLFINSNNIYSKLRKLAIRTYKVIPLSPTAGLLQWVEQTIPLRTYLTENSFVPFIFSAQWHSARLSNLSLL